LPRIQGRERARIERHYKKDTVRMSVALAQLSHRHEIQRAKLQRAKDHVDEWRVRLRQQNDFARTPDRRLPCGRGSS